MAGKLGILVLLFGGLAFQTAYAAQTCDCYFNGDHNKHNRCAGVFCAYDYQCASGKCLNKFCTPMNDFTTNCNSDSTAICGKCPGLKCVKSTEDTNYFKYQCQLGCGTEDGLNYKCTDCTCDFDNIKSKICVGKYCEKDEECLSGKCLGHYCTDPKDDKKTCSNNVYAKCGKCPGVTCEVGTFGQGLECQLGSCLKSLGNKCASCECSRLSSIRNLCDGVYCDADFECASGRCYLGFCAHNSSTTDTCNLDSDYGCGKCDKTVCRRNFECQNGACDDGFCYDTDFWLILLISVIIGFFLIVAISSYCLVRKRNRERRIAALGSQGGSESGSEAGEGLLNGREQRR